MDELIVTIDGPAAVGKSTAARLLAERLNAAFLDTGAMYRAVTLAALQNKTDLKDVEGLLEILSETEFGFTIEGGVMQVSVDGVDVTGLLRDPELTEQVKYVASKPAIRGELIKMQRQFAGQHKKVVTEGRDQGTVAFPDADYKFFLVAEPSERARRRQSDLEQIGRASPLEKIQADIEKRDDSDKKRAIGPLAPAGEAVVIDTTNLTAEQTVDKMLKIITAGGESPQADPEM